MFVYHSQRGIIKHERVENNQERAVCFLWSFFRRATAERFCGRQSNDIFSGGIVGGNSTEYLSLFYSGVDSIMWGFVVLLAVWMTYVETEMPNRTNECPYIEYGCNEEESADGTSKMEEE